MGHRLRGRLVACAFGNCLLSVRHNLQSYQINWRAHCYE